MEFEIRDREYYAKIVYSVDQSIPSNQSVITITDVQIKTTSLDRRSAMVYGDISVNGTLCASLTYGYTYSCAVDLTEQYMSVTKGGFISNQSVVIHNDDGSKTVPVKVSLTMAAGGQHIADFTIDTTQQMPNIPRVSTITASQASLGSFMSIHIERSYSAFTDTVTYTCGQISEVISTKTSYTNLAWTVPLDLATQSPNATFVTIKLTVETFNGDTSVGTRDIYVNCDIPDSVVPSVSITSFLDVDGHVDRFGSFVLNQSTVRVSASFGGAYGSAVTQLVVRCGSNSVTVPATGSSATVDIIVGASPVAQVDVIAFDSRGRYGVASSSQFGVFEYERPIVSIERAFRCNERGEAQFDGNYACVVFNSRVSTIGNRNGIVYYVQYYAVGETTWTTLEIPLISGVDKYNLVSYSYGFQLSGNDPTNNEYRVEVYARDSVGTTGTHSMRVTIPVAFALMDFDRTNRAIGFGKQATVPGEMTIGMNVEMNGFGLKHLGSLDQPITSTSDDTPTNWHSIGNSISYYHQAGALIDQPNQYGFLLNFSSLGASVAIAVYQVWCRYGTAEMYTRSGTASGWLSTWKKLSIDTNATSQS